MNRTQQNVILHLGTIFLLTLIFCFTDLLLVLISAVTLYFLYLILYQVDLKNYFKYMWCPLIVVTVFTGIYYFIFRDSFQATLVFIKCVFILKSFIFFCSCYSWMEIFYAFEKLLYPLDFVGISSMKCAWYITKTIRNISIYYRNLQEQSKKHDTSNKTIEKNLIYDKMEHVRIYLKMAKRLSNVQIKKLDEMMYLRLFRVERSRTNYKVKSAKKHEIIFVIVMFGILISEVIL